MVEKAHEGLEGGSTVPAQPPAAAPKTDADPKRKAAPKPGKSPAALATEASKQAEKAAAKADKTAAAALDKAPVSQMIRVIGIKHHECKIVKQRIKIVKGEVTEVSKFVYDVLTNPELPGPIIKYVP